jgi:putative hydrolase of the HAD superfamily
MTGWLLLDYGQVLSTAPPEDEWDRLRRAAGEAGEDPGRFHSSYWEHRPAYDRADTTVEEYWSLVLGRAPGPEQMEELIRWDVAIWLHPHDPSVAAAHRAAGRGWRLALFSNAPVEVAAGIDALEWLEPFERRFYSCRIGRIKPEADAYRRVISELAVDPADIVFFDDRPPNVEVAAGMGIRAHVFTDAAQIDLV